MFTGFLVLLLVRQLAYGESFFPLYFLMDLSKYAADSVWRTSATTH